MGLAVAQKLTSLGGWTIHILDLHLERGTSAASSLGSDAQFHQTNVTDYENLLSVFQTIYSQTSRLDFVFANAGIAEHANFFSPQTDPPPPPKGLEPIVDINLKSVVTTCYLALHYMRKSPKSLDKSLVITASCGGLYPSYYSPIYTATKHAVVGLMRSIAPYFFSNAGIRVNAICPGTVRTNLLSPKEWENFPDKYFTPVEKIAETVAMLVEGQDGEKGESQGVLRGKAVEVSGRMHYYREPVEFCDGGMRAVMGATDIEVLENAQQWGS
ncbi:NAD(P)-binding protein [Lindgomyces ingoldianus]|uniref:NAD(P)-binding protein n=1 Tax=Lindgomyces ingoldianus TaxID=673940 RepID=A0ACB6QUM7_9PLEO|nr:NAD(P)-binding protein [Lindgomyces ingoldianus]KAF2470273.1 NAD(P)-binding protein [Lindgomyces ingoldianus]